jgi:hypothetical protein
MLEGGALHRGREYNRGTGCGHTARPGLHGGCRVTGIPTVEAARAPDTAGAFVPDNATILGAGSRIAL